MAFAFSATALPWARHCVECQEQVSAQAARPARRAGLPECPLMRDTERVPDRCTCGAQLPPDARFCHKCAKPQYEISPEFEPEITLPPVQPAAEPPAPPVPVEINFRNFTAVRVGLLAAGIASLLISLPLPPPVNLLWLFLSLVCAGAFAVFLYRRRTGQPLSDRSGARMGWITGIFCFVIGTIFLTISMVALASQGGLAEYYRKNMPSGASEANVQQALELMQHPGGITVLLVFIVILLFVFFTALPTLGGWLGAKLLSKDGHTH